VPPPRFNLTEFQKEFLGLLDQPTEGDRSFKDQGEAEQEKELLLDKLAQFRIEGRVSDILSGPMITRFEFEPAPGIKVSSVENLADDLSLALSAERIRILAPIPGKNAVGIEIPNKVRQTVFLRDVLTSEGFRKEKSPLGFALGTTITGEPCSSDLRTMPHILIAGTTGSGKSVCINSIISSIIYRSSYRDVRFLTIDPKQLELPLYNPIPHLLGRTTTDPGQAVNQLTRIVNIMDARIGEFAKLGVRDIAGFNARAEEEGFERKPYIVVVIDELADLMLRAENEMEQRITRLAQMSRAVGIHLIIATQRPSVDVITGLIKANFPCRIAFQVASKTDSRTILDLNGAEALLGRGDMLFLPPGKGEPARLHGTFISDRAAKRIVDLWSRTYLTELLTGLVDNPADRAERLVAADVVDAFYDPEKSGIKKKQDELRAVLPEEAIDSLMSRQYYSVLSEESPEVMAERTRVQQQQQTLDFDEKFAEAARIVVRHREASVSMLQRRLDVGWARAGRITDQLEQAGIVGPYVGSKSRKVLVSGEAELERVLAELGNR
jgi:S-DNA-T family DNA segregation ATPase FtsK/SpoIIIE